MSSRKRSPSKKPPVKRPPIDWTEEISRAKRDLERSGQQINANLKGTPGQKRSDWQPGESPSSYPETR